VNGPDAGRIRELLNPISAVLEADGYRLHVGEASETSVRVDVVAGDEACAECLVQKPLLSAMIQRELSGAGLPLDVVLGYPTDGDH
jgi:L-ascorbate metabolism protein UlaG (beta-lactamase superfamily)